MGKRARIYQGNGYYPSPSEIEAGSDGDARLRALGVLYGDRRHLLPKNRGQLWERVAEQVS